MNYRSMIVFLDSLEIKIEKSTKEWIAYYKGKPLDTIAIRHTGEKGIKLPYLWKVLREELIRDGLRPGSKEYEME